MFRGFSGNEISNRFISHVGGQSQKAGAYDSEAKLFISFSGLFFCIDCHSPQQCGARCNLDKAVDSETDK